MAGASFPHWECPGFRVQPRARVGHLLAGCLGNRRGELSLSPSLALPACALGQGAAEAPLASTQLAQQQEQSPQPHTAYTTPWVRQGLGRELSQEQSPAPLSAASMTQIPSKAWALWEPLGAGRVCWVTLHAQGHAVSGTASSLAGQEGAWPSGTAWHSPSWQSLPLKPGRQAQW